MHLDSLSSIEASIWSGGVELKEYADPHVEEDEGPLSNITARSYIEAIDGAVFEIKLKALGPSYIFDCELIGACIYVDGRSIDFRSITPNHRQVIFRGEIKYAGDERTLRKFIFSKIQLTEDQNNLSAESVENVGEIKLLLHRMRRGKNKITPSRSSGKDAPENLSEKQLKGRAISHGTSYGQPEVTKIKEELHRTVEYIDDIDKPLVVLKFLYRSKAALQSMLVIPRTPSPPPPSPPRCASEPKSNVLSTSDGVEVKTEKKIKRERGDDSKSGREKKRRTSAVIDLTQDVDEDEAKPVVFKKFKTEDGKPGIDLT